jgi:Planctomycete cytochrome C
MKKLFETFPGLFALAGAGFTFLVSCQLSNKTGAVSPPAVVTSCDAFEKTIKPFFEKTCLECHNHQKHNSGLNFQDPATLYVKNKSEGPFLDPGSPETSRIYLAIIKPQTHPGAMPANGWGIDLTDLQMLRTWIKEGAKWPEGPAGQLASNKVN